MKKIIINNHKFVGGAPVSLLEYAKILNHSKFEVISTGEVLEENQITNDYQDNGIVIFNKNSFGIKDKFFKNFNSLLRYYRIILKEEPNLIFSITSENLFFDHIISKIFNTPIIYLIPGGNPPKVVVDTINNLLLNETIIVYSLEASKAFGNKQNNDIEVIPNRYSINKTLLSNKTEHGKKYINFLLISRLDKGKMNSVNYLINEVIKMNSKNYEVILDIIGDGNYLDDLTELADKINSKNNRNIVNILGYKNDVERYISNSDIIFGKGRSVLDGVFNEKLSVVLNENNQAYPISIGNFNTLQDANFTGRNYEYLNETSIEDIYFLFTEKILNNRELVKLRQIAIKQYDIDYVKENILALVNKKIASQSPNYKVKLVSFKLCFFYFKLYFNFLKAKVGL